MTMIEAESGPITRGRVVAYNATVERIIRPHEHLMVLRVRPDWGRLEFLPGQYTVLGLGAWEPHVGAPPAAAMNPPKADPAGPVMMRAYSISCSLLDEQGRLLRPQESPYLEFYIALVPTRPGRRPGLTARLFALSEGQRLFVGQRAHGRYVLAPVHTEDAVIFAATGTGEAPHNAMLAELLAAGRRGPMVAVTCVRQRRDLAYLEAHRELERRYPHYRYLALTTREPENVDATLPNYVGKQYLQDYLRRGAMEKDSGVELVPGRTHLFLCGNPAMIGVPSLLPGGGRAFPQPAGMVEVLERRGFRMDLPRQPGNIHFEKYW